MKTTKLRHCVLSVAWAVMGLLGASCTQAGAAGGGGGGHNAAAAAAADAEKLLIPAQSWNCGMPEGIPKPEAGVLVFEGRITLDQVYDVGKTPFGNRVVAVAQGGTITGPKLQGSLLPGSLDFQLTLSNGVVEIEQVLMVRMADGKYIYMRNAGTGPQAADVRVVLDIEAPANSASAWLNAGKYVGRRVVDAAAKTLQLSVYDVSQVAAPAPPSGSRGVIRIVKPAGVPEQPWDYRKAGPTERPGEAFVVENVTLGPSQSVGASKRGNRNVIPITGGTLTGTVPGKVLPGGADYQNLSNAPTIDARYLWQAANGEIIIVRNTGPFGSLVPTFETRTDGTYAWLNKGSFLSSNPGIGAGGVSLTMYKSN